MGPCKPIEVIAIRSRAPRPHDAEPEQARIEDGGSRIEPEEARIEDGGSRIETDAPSGEEIIDAEFTDAAPNPLPDSAPSTQHSAPLPDPPDPTDASPSSILNPPSSPPSSDPHSAPNTQHPALPPDPNSVLSPQSSPLPSTPSPQSPPLSSTASPSSILNPPSSPPSSDPDSAPSTQHPALPPDPHSVPSPQSPPLSSTPSPQSSPLSSRRAPAFTPAQQQALGELSELTHCPVRRQILRTLATGGRRSVTALMEATGFGQKTLSHHLSPLRLAGLIHKQPAGQRVLYEINETRVFAATTPDGGFALTVLSRARDAWLTTGVGTPPLPLQPSKPPSSDSPSNETPTNEPPSPQPAQKGASTNEHE